MPKAKTAHTPFFLSTVSDMRTQQQTEAMNMLRDEAAMKERAMFSYRRYFAVMRRYTEFIPLLQMTWEDAKPIPKAMTVKLSS